ncbi:DUF2510 domain-containing protein [Microbacterium sp. NPDC008134]|uniref:DUF2510 domain-containing protein n=1 Tax=Microbacterium sp. NPDC008134 TaxID=3364183 RepID=UPI0036EBE31B
MTTPAGWYDDGSGRQRWWDGEQWTEHFAPETSAPEASTPVEEPLPVVPTEAEIDTTIAAAESDEPSAVVDAPSEEATSDVAPADAAPETPADVAPEAPAYVAPEAPAYTAPEAPAYVAPEAPAYTAPEAPAYAAPAYSAPGYPATAPGSAPAYGVAPTGAYPAAGAPYGGAPGGYAPYPGAPVAEPRPMSVLGLVGLGLAVLGTILVCFLVTAVFGWILLFAGLVVSIVSLFLKGKKWPGITGIGVSVLGGIVGGIMAIVFFTFSIAQSAIDYAESYSPPPVPSIGTDGGSSGEIVEGTMGSPVTVNQYSGESEVTITAASWGTSNGSSFEAENGGYLSVELTWEAISGDVSVNPLYFTVIDADGVEGTYDYFGDATLESAQLTPGETVQGTLSFDVAQSDSYTIVITDELLQDVAEVTIEASAR